MKKELCFIIEEKKLFLEKVLVEYNEIPIFYLCIDSKNVLYLVLCADIDEDRYIVVQPRTVLILKMLHGDISMREIILTQNYFWEIYAKDNMAEDVVVKKAIKEIEEDVLPYTGECYSIPSEEIAKYIEQLEQTILTGDFVQVFAQDENVLFEDKYTVNDIPYINFENQAISWRHQLENMHSTRKDFLFQIPEKSDTILKSTLSKYDDCNFLNVEFDNLKVNAEKEYYIDIYESKDGLLVA